MRKKTWEKNQYIYYFADKQNIQMQKGSSLYLYITSTVCPEFAQNTQYLNHFISKFKKIIISGVSIYLPK